MSDAVRFLDLYAGDSRESSGDEEFEDIDNVFIEEYANARGPVASSSKSSVLPTSAHLRNTDEDPEAIVGQLRERMRKRRRLGAAPHDVHENSDVVDQLVIDGRKSRFPESSGHVDDSAYEMFLVRAANAEQDARLAQQAFPSDCLALYVPWLRGRYYTWVPSIKSVRDMLRARNRTIGTNTIVFVPPSEVDGIFRLVDCSKPTSTITRMFEGNWVKILKGKYSGDFGLVKDRLSDGYLRIYVVPRVEILAAHRSQQHRPLQRTVSVDWLKSTFPEEEINELPMGNSFTFRNGLYENGLRVLRLHTSKVERAFPSPQEVFLFKNIHLGDLEKVEYYTRQGDIVAVLSGEMRGLVGTVTERQEDSVIIGKMFRCKMTNDKRDAAAVTNEPVLRCPWSERVSCNDEECSVEHFGMPDVCRLRRIQVLLNEVHAESEFTEVSVPIKLVRRFIDPGDEVVVKVGPSAERPGLVVDMDGDYLDVQLDAGDTTIKVLRYWVETADGGGSVKYRKTEETKLQPGALVMIQSGFLKGRWMTVMGVQRPYVHFKLPCAEAGKNILLSVREDDVERFSPEMIETGRLPVLEGSLTNERTHSPFVGMFVLILNRDGADQATQLAKGMYGYVTNVDEKRRTANVAYQAKETVIPLKNLVSYDYVFSLDNEHPLTKKEADDLSRRFREYAKRTEPRSSKRAATPTPSDPDLDDIRFGEEIRLDTDLPSAVRCTDPVTDFSPDGYWVFDPSVQAQYATHKVFVRVRSKNRVGYITGRLEDDHSQCFWKHTGCRVRVNIDWSRSIIPTTVNVSDLEPARPTKKNEPVLQIRYFGGLGARHLLAKGVPKGHERPITVCTADDPRRCWDMPARNLTRVEKK